jgi:crotonobetainyl-CoA:carnitine CoA-transferase CaiB-like acyl-CoA transferase
MTMALEGITVLDLTRLLPGAFCSQILADLGADVIKIEHPNGGDYGRTFPPMAKRESGSFLLLNRNKRSVTLDLKSEAGKGVFRKLAVGADVLMEGFRPGVMERLGLSYDSLKADNPGLIYCAISGYGQDGPLKLAPGHDLNYLGQAGALQLFGRAGEPPIVPGLSVADVGGGSLTAATGIMAALLARGRTGRVRVRRCLDVRRLGRLAVAARAAFPVRPHRAARRRASLHRPGAVLQRLSLRRRA